MASSPSYKLGELDAIGVNLSQTLLKSRFQVEPGNAIEAASNASKAGRASQ